jgi:hypothetical protein
MSADWACHDELYDEEDYKSWENILKMPGSFIFKSC